MKLWLVRHAKPLIAEGLCYGQLDIAAEPSATQQAAIKIAPLLPKNAMLYSSGLQRARQLAQAIQSERDDLSHQIDPRLNEINFGAWEGVAWNAIPKSAFDAWTADFGLHRFGDVESTQDLLIRIRQALDELPVNRDAVWITHAGVIRAVHYLQTNHSTLITAANQWPVEAPAFGEWQCLNIFVKP